MAILSKLRIIIADDHPVFRKGLKNILKGSKAISQITLASNGNEVISILEKCHHDVVLMDVRMAPLDGIETTGIVTQRFPNTRVVALTMNDDEYTVTQMLRNGASGYLVKSSDKEEIIAAVKEASIGNKYFSKEINYLLARKIIEVPKQDNKNDNSEL